MAASNRTYVSNGQVLNAPPLTARLSRTGSDIYNFFGLYFVSLFSLDPYTAAQNSQFNTSRPSSSSSRPRWASSTRSAPSSGSSTSNSRGNQNNQSNNQSRPKKPMGTVDDVRGPECGSCG